MNCYADDVSGFSEIYLLADTIVHSTSFISELTVTTWQQT